MRVRFWGVRGSIPWANALCIGYGCNTPCIELLHDSGDVLVLDAGSGLVGLGRALRGHARPVAILLTHHHWDHLQGLPFFAPLYQPGCSPAIWAPPTGMADTYWLETIFRPPFFPVAYEDLPAPPAVRPVGAGRHTIATFAVRAIELNHPGGAFAYRIRGTRGDLVYATDHELGDPTFDEPLARFVAGARALVLDAHFTPEESARHRGWGHSNWTDAARFAAGSGVERLWLFHHMPGRTDVELTEIETEARRIFEPTDAASEGDSFDL
jgi:phosphoribosyl 1,2-cyclic phosphodiesterase